MQIACVFLQITRSRLDLFYFRNSGLVSFHRKPLLVCCRTPLGAQLSKNWLFVVFWSNKHPFGRLVGDRIFFSKVNARPEVFSNFSSLLPSKLCLSTTRNVQYVFFHRFFMVLKGIFWVFELFRQVYPISWSDTPFRWATAPLSKASGSQPGKRLWRISVVWELIWGIRA